MTTPKIYGTTTLNDKSQVVIPVDARNALGIGPGSKLMVMGTPNGRALIFITTQQAEYMMREMTESITAALEDARDAQ
jgi:AbrB family looped-hinge helix DNA binding protein